MDSDSETSSDSDNSSSKLSSSEDIEVLLPIKSSRVINNNQENLYKKIMKLIHQLKF